MRYDPSTDYNINGLLEETPPKPTPSINNFPEEQREWISTPGGDIELTYTIELIINYLRPARNPKHNKQLINCPKCSTRALQAKKGFFGGINLWAGIGNMGITSTKKLNLNALETHIENGKEVIAICLKCNHNRSPLSPFATAENAKIKKPKETITVCNKCFSRKLALHDKYTGEAVKRLPGQYIEKGDWPNFYFQCSDCGNKQHLTD